MKRSGMALVRLMEEDGLEIPASPDPIRRMACFRTEHQYFSPLWINVVEGTFSCKVVRLRRGCLHLPGRDSEDS